MQQLLWRGMALAVLAGFGLILSACGGISAEGLTGDEASDIATELTGEFRALAVDPDEGDVLQMTTSGLFRSPDAGRTWELVSDSSAIDWSVVDGLLLNPDQPSTLYIWGTEIGLFRTDDAGKAWRAVADQLPSEQVAAVALHSNQRDILYAWIREHGVFRTKDGGQGWEAMDAGPESDSVAALAHSPLEGSMNTGWLYAGAPEGVYLSMDCF